MDTDKTDLGLLAAGLRAFFRLADEWDLSEAEQIILLGSPAEFELARWRRGDVASGSGETLKRISLMLGIYKAIQTLLPDRARANRWMRAPNFAPIFSGGSALDQMLRGDIADLRRVRTYLDAQLG
ncbi:MbcA/ParS/Xre antitoxin family protein [Sphingopyxis witflariensis]|uniref:MbcA/ParS/Xre antitoxin family protein n=1 Tax=Sphingopyxis witflariensis TaxID=173675 RepID=UPI00191C8C82|nr:MbcA/ParS/Xre antitoxin family protein [Sphingopyxis witflariensis]